MQRNAFRRRHYGSAAFVAATFALSFAALSLVFAGRSAVINATVAAFACVPLELARRARVSRLEQQIRLATGARSYAIYVNGVRTGAIREADYLALRLDALLAPRNYIRQFGVVGRFAVKCIAATAVVIPVGLFWWIVLAACLAPHAATSNLGAIYHMLSDAKNPADMYRQLSSLGELILTTAAMFTFLMPAALVTYGAADGVTNSCFRAHVDQRLRGISNCPADGWVHVESDDSAPVQQPALTGDTRVL